MSLYAVYAREINDKKADLELIEDCLSGTEAGKLVISLDSQGYQTVIVHSLKSPQNTHRQTG